MQQATSAAGAVALKLMTDPNAPAAVRQAQDAGVNVECALVEGVSGNESAPRTVPIMTHNR